MTNKQAHLHDVWPKNLEPAFIFSSRHLIQIVGRLFLTLRYVIAAPLLSLTAPSALGFLEVPISGKRGCMLFRLVFPLRRSSSTLSLHSHFRVITFHLLCVAAMAASLSFVSSGVGRNMAARAARHSALMYWVRARQNTYLLHSFASPYSLHASFQRQC